MIFYKKGAENSVPFFLSRIYRKSNMCMNWFNRIVSLNKMTFGMMPDTVEHAQALKDKEKKELEKVVREEPEINVVAPEPKLPKLRYEEIIQVDFPENRYFKEQTDKRQIVLHHTVSGRGVAGDINWWKQNPQRIATAVIIEWNGDIYQLFSSRYWAHHLGVRAANNRALNEASIGIEIDAWGGLIKYNRKWYPARWDENKRKHVADTRIAPIKDVVTYPDGYRGFYGYEKYTDEQIESVRKLLVYWGKHYNIPLKYNDDMWEISQKALRGDAGVWSHTSFRQDKSDVHPQKELVDMLKSL